MTILSTAITLATNVAILGTFYIISQVLTWLLALAAMVISIRYGWRSQHRYMKVLSIYLIGDVFSEVVSFFMPPDRMNIAVVYSLFETWTFLYFFYLVLQNKWRNYPIVLSGLFYLLVFLFCKQCLSEKSQLETAVITESVLLVIFSIFYFRQIFSHYDTDLLERDPKFWIVTGIFFYSLFDIPVVWFTNYYSIMKNRELAKGIYSFNNISLSVAYILYIKGMICLTKK